MQDETSFNNVKVLGTIQLGNQQFDAQGLANLLALINGMASERAVKQRDAVRTISPGGYLPQFGVSARWVPAHVLGHQLGENVLYTCPADRKALYTTTNYLNIGGSGSAYVAVKKAGTGRLVRMAVNGAPAANTFSQSSLCYFMSPGDSLVAIGLTGAGLYVTCRVIEFKPDESQLFLTAENAALAVGDNLVYRCPAGKSAWLLPAIPATPANATVNYQNDTTGAKTARLQFGTLAPTLPLSNPAGLSVAVGVVQGFGTYVFVLRPGEALFLTKGEAGEAGESAWTNLVEVAD